MKTETLIIGGLAGIALVGIIGLSILQLDTTALVSALSALVGYLVGSNRGVIGGYLGRVKK